jgi:hypothetical protein
MQYREILLRQALNDGTAPDEYAAKVLIQALLETERN